MGNSVSNELPKNCSASGVFKGWVNHRRLYPTAHEFSYSVFMFYLNIDEIEQMSFLNTSSRKWNLFKPWIWKREDYFDGSSQPLREIICQWVSSQGYTPTSGPITLLTNVRCFGYLINPISVYFMFDNDGENIKYIIAEVTNTPWGERKHYLIHCDDNNRVENYLFDKAMHVSPFHGMDLQYVWRSNVTEKQLDIHLLCNRDDERVFDATLSLQRQSFSKNRLKKLFVEHPCMTMKVVWGIYWQAFKLFLKKVPIFPHPKSLK